MSGRRRRRPAASATLLPRAGENAVTDYDCYELEGGALHLDFTEAMKM